MQDFANRVGVVTGAASGIGLATAAALARAGMRIVLIDARGDALSTAAASLSATGAEVLPLTVDVTDAEAVAAAAAAVIDRFGAIHLLMNNAAVFLRGSAIAEIGDEVWDWLLGVNLYGPIHCIRSMLPLMQGHAEPGHIVNTASISGMAVRDRKNGAYAVSKFGLVALSEALRHDLRDTNIGVSVVFPGLVASEFYVTSAGHRGDLGGLNLFPTTPADTAQGMPPAEVAARILDGIRDDRFYIATHDNTRQQLEDRHTEIMAAYDAAAAWRPA
jgi:NAD(P)-dependent dehydrogenase (short-subunit alcohol dehydrogenase family)